MQLISQHWSIMCNVELGTTDEHSTDHPQNGEDSCLLYHLASCRAPAGQGNQKALERTMKFYIVMVQAL